MEKVPAAEGEQAIVEAFVGGHPAGSPVYAKVRGAVPPEVSAWSSTGAETVATAGVA